jgi:hypothetical protein
MTALLNIFNITTQGVTYATVRTILMTFTLTWNHQSDVLRRNHSKTELPEDGISGCWNASERKLVSDIIHKIQWPEGGFTVPASSVAGSCKLQKLNRWVESRLSCMVRYGTEMPATNYTYHNLGAMQYLELESHCEFKNFWRCLKSVNGILHCNKQRRSAEAPLF